MLQDLRQMTSGVNCVKGAKFFQGGSYGGQERHIRAGHRKADQIYMILPCKSMTLF